MRRILQLLVLITSTGLVGSCAGPRSGDAERKALEPALDRMATDSLLGHIRVLASDEFEGRAPGTKGEQLTVDYLINEFKKYGLKPGNPDGSYEQSVPLLGSRAEPEAFFTSAGKKLEVTFPADFVARAFQPEVRLEDSEIVFVGYGVVAPEYEWDDYKGVDVRGKTILMLINDPAIPDPRDPSKLDPGMFRGSAMTYYGRWSYKFEIAAEKGASAAVIIHETGPAGYPYEVISGGWNSEHFDIRTTGGPANRVSVESWVSLETATKLLAMSGQDFANLKSSAASRDFSPVPLSAKATFRVKTSFREVQSRNVVARLEGSDAKLKDEYVIYSAHWDHFGKDERLQGDQIFNGASDNASGTAALLQLAEAGSAMEIAPRRSMLFLAVTAEEKGLLGAKYYAQNPLYPLRKTVANINLDIVNQWGRTSDIVVIGSGNSTLEDVLQQELQAAGRVMRADPEPEKGYYYRSDHFEFAKLGVPALYTKSGADYIGRPPEYGMSKRAEYTARDYHKVTDEVKDDWDLSGAVEDLRLMFKVGYRVAQDEKIPEWKPGTEFKARREAMLKAVP